LIFSDMNFKC